MHILGDLSFRDDELEHFATNGAPPLPEAVDRGYVEHDGARIWYAAYGSGHPVVLLHGGLGHSGNWGHQIPALIAGGFHPVVIDTRGHGRSTRDTRPFSYELLASDVRAVMDALHIDHAPFIGWSDGACTALVLAATHPSRCSGVFFFACNMDPSGAKPIVPSPALDRCFARHRTDYAHLSPTPDDFAQLVEDVGRMQRTQPNYTAEELGKIRVPVTIAHAEHDEFIYREHAEYLAGAIPGAKMIMLEGVSHFAPLQRPALFNAAAFEFLGQTENKNQSESV